MSRFVLTLIWVFFGALVAISAHDVGAQTRPQNPSTAPSAPVADLPAVGATLRLRSPTKDNSNYELSSTAKMPTLVMFWSTDCAVCKNKMSDIRRELAQANGRFQVVLVNTDRSWDTAAEYERILQTTNGNSTGSGVKPVRIWRGETGYQDSVGAAVGVANRTPVSIVVGPTGLVTEVIAGRFDDAVWQRLRTMPR
jgi:thiol-disulfide isomerase/thioredoxin